MLLILQDMFKALSNVSSGGIKFEILFLWHLVYLDGSFLLSNFNTSGAPNDGIFPNASKVSEICYSVLGKPV